MWAAVAVVAVALAGAPGPAHAGGHSAVRSLDAASVDLGDEVVVTVEVRDFGRYGRVSETLPGGWTYSGSSLPEAAVIVEAGTVKFLLLNLDAAESVVFTYTLTAPVTEGAFALSGIIEDEDRQSETIGGDGEIMVTDQCRDDSGGTVPAVDSPPGNRSGRFCDVAVGAPYWKAVRYLQTGGVLGGTLCEDGFCPSKPMNRRTLAVWIVRVLDERDPRPITQSRFDDVDPQIYKARFIERMAELGVTQGCGDGSRFCPAGRVSRAEMAVILSRAYSLPDGPDPGFADVPAGAWYEAGVAKLAAAGITRGCGDGTVFCPDRETTRGEAALFLHRAETADTSTG